MPAVRTAKVQKLGLTSAVNSPIPLTVSGSVIKYSFDPTQLQVTGGSAGCVPKAPKDPLASNTCVVNNATGEITMTSTDASVVKPGKPIVGAPLTIDFDYVAGIPGGISNIKFVSAATAITISGNTVDVLLQASGTTYFTNVPSIVISDPNVNAPAAVLSGLI